MHKLQHCNSISKNLPVRKIILAKETEDMKKNKMKFLELKIQ